MVWVPGDPTDSGLQLGDYDTRQGLTRIYSESPLVERGNQSWWTPQDILDRALDRLERGGRKGLSFALRAAIASLEADPMRRSIDGYYMRNLVYWSLIEDYLAGSEGLVSGAVGVAGGASLASVALIPWATTLEAPEYGALVRMFYPDKKGKKDPWADYNDTAESLAIRFERMIQSKHPYIQWLQDLGVMGRAEGGLRGHTRVNYTGRGVLLGDLFMRFGLPIDYRIAWLPYFDDVSYDEIEGADADTVKAAFDIENYDASVYETGVEAKDTIFDALPFLFNVRGVSGAYAYVVERINDNDVFQVRKAEEAGEIGGETYEEGDYLASSYDHYGNEMDPTVVPDADAADYEPAYAWHVGGLAFTVSVSLDSLVLRQYVDAQVLEIEGKYERENEVLRELSDVLSTTTYGTEYAAAYKKMNNLPEMEIKAVPTWIYSVLIGKTKEKPAREADPTYQRIKKNLGF